MHNLVMRVGCGMVKDGPETVGIIFCTTYPGHV